MRDFRSQFQSVIAVNSNEKFLRLVLSMFFCVLFQTQAILCQSPVSNSSTISGYLFDSETNKPLPSANIFLSKTTIGNTSDSTGYFELKNIPPGNYELTFRFIGYIQKSIPIEIQKNNHVDVDNVKLREDPILLENISVTTSRPKEWLNNLKKFDIAFLGQTDNASQTEILNPEILEFNFEKGKLLAESDEDLQVINHALGYRLFIKLDSFIWSTFHDLGQYFFNARIEKLTPEDEAQKLSWKENRADTYKGSFRHFLQLLIADKVEEAFSLKNGNIELIAEGSGKYDGILVYQVNTPGNEPLHVEYKRQKTSEIAISKNQWLQVDTYGNLINNKNVSLAGYWATHRIADFLPFDYQGE